MGLLNTKDRRGFHLRQSTFFQDARNLQRKPGPHQLLVCIRQIEVGEYIIAALHHSVRLRIASFCLHVR